MRMMIKGLISAAALAAIVPAAGAGTINERCALVADAAGNAAHMRLDGASQKETAKSASIWFSKLINSPKAVAKMSDGERRAFSDEWAGMATQMIRLVYSLPKKDLRSDEHVAKTVYRMCVRG